MVTIGWNFGNQAGNFSPSPMARTADRERHAPLADPGHGEFQRPPQHHDRTGTGSGTVNGNFVSTSSSPVGAWAHHHGKGVNIGSISGTFNATSEWSERTAAADRQRTTLSISAWSISISMRARFQ